MRSARRRYLDRTKPKDTREIIHHPRGVATCDEYAAAARKWMERVDALPREYRDLVHAFNIKAADLERFIAAGISADAVRCARFPNARQWHD